MTRIVRCEDLVLTVREDRLEQDLEIVRRVVVDDRYRLRMLKRRRPKLDVIVDIGGHLGSFGLFAKSLWPEAMLIALEPNLESAELYRRSLDENGFDDDVVLVAALGYCPEKRVLVGDSRCTGRCVLVTPEEAKQFAPQPLSFDGGRYEILARDIRTLTVDQVLGHFDLPRIDLMKLDCEGGEFDICRHVAIEHALRIGMLVGEYHSPGGFEDFGRDVRRAFPHLYFFGDSPEAIGPFWGVPSLAFAARCYLSRQLIGFSRRLAPLFGNTERDRRTIRVDPPSETPDYGHRPRFAEAVTRNASQ